MRYKVKRFPDFVLDRKEGVEIKHLNPISPLRKIGVKSGDILLSVNGNKIRDILDFYFYFSEFKSNVLEIFSQGQGRILLKILLGEKEDLGLSLAPIKPLTCKNNCIFCFVSQHPKNPKPRKTLLIRDDDYRLSFLDGNFITLSNLEDRDIERICSQKLWPLYISVHTMNRELRRYMMRCSGSDFFYVFDKLCKCGVKFHTQIVLCPNINDGENLDYTIKELFKRRKNVLSVGIVPVGLTKYRENLFKIDPFDLFGARHVLKQTFKYHNYFRKKLGIGFIYLADEFFLKAKKMVPDTKYYDDFPQLENGIGMVRLFVEKFNELFIFDDLKVKNRNFSVLTGESFYPIVSKLISKINKKHNLNIKIFCVKNFFFGEEITVTGLLTAGDIITQLKGRKDFGEFLCIPGETLMAEEDVFLDNLSTSDIKDELKIDVIPLRYGPSALKDVIEGKFC